MCKPTECAKPIELRQLRKLVIFIIILDNILFSLDSQIGINLKALIMNNDLLQHIIVLRDAEVDRLTQGRIFNFLHEPILINGRIFNFIREPKEGQIPYAELTQQRRNVVENNYRHSVGIFNESNDYNDLYNLKICKFEMCTAELFTGLEFKIRHLPTFEQPRMADYDYAFMKDRFNISDSLWQIMRTNFPILELPSDYRMNKIKKEINRGFVIHEIFVPTVINQRGDIELISKGFFVDPELWINFQLRSLVRKKPQIFESQRIVIKIGLDGFQLARESNLLNFCFAIINEGKVASTATGTYPVGFFNIDTENYTELEPIVTEIWQRMRLVNKFNYNGIDYPIIYDNGGDYKMQLIVSLKF